MRRAFLTICACWLASIAMGQPVSAQTRLPRIGYLHSGDLDHYRLLVDRFKSSLADFGFIEGKNVAIEYRWAQNNLTKLPGLAGDLISLDPDVIVTAGGSPSAFAAAKATHMIPIVFSMGEDPVSIGLISSFNRPLGNATGSTFLGLSLWSKRFELMRDLLPQTKHASAILDHSSSTWQDEVEGLKQAAATQNVALSIFSFESVEELDGVIASAMSGHPDVVIAGASVLLTANRSRLISGANDLKIPVIGSTTLWTNDGALASIGGSIGEGYSRSGEYAAKLLRGAKVADLPVRLPTRFEVVINSRAARQLGLSLPQRALVLADEVIE